MDSHSRKMDARITIILVNMQSSSLLPIRNAWLVKKLWQSPLWATGAVVVVLAVTISFIFLAETTICSVTNEQDENDDRRTCLLVETEKPK
ncbi:hypothetical protein BC941DRAFT_468223 [Chlamydoabsidia padenii]|nr:hypothetical protein BC941DRAFT_468223 [Chlamydoabsidia padenii]